VRDLNKKEAMIIDMTIVRDKNISKAFTDKINMYSKLHKHIRKIERLVRVIVIRVVITVSGLINKETVRLLKAEGIEIPWEIMTRENVITNMKDLMRYCGDNSGEYSNVEVPEEEDSQESEGREEILI
ncbi:reverse transcriptase, putative, partial [Entamoeba histolytica KU27]